MNGHKDDKEQWQPHVEWFRDLSVVHIFMSQRRGKPHVIGYLNNDAALGTASSVELTKYTLEIVIRLVAKFYLGILKVELVLLATKRIFTIAIMLLGNFTGESELPMNYFGII